MALYVPGGVIGGGVISGKLGSNVFTRNRGGQVIRNLVAPINPNSSYQQAVRARMAALTNAWFNILTAGQRTAWETYATNVLRTNRIGVPRNLTGANWYIACNTFRMQNLQDRADDAPANFVMASYTPLLTLAASEATQAFTITFDDTDEWCDLDGAALGLYASAPHNVTRNYFKGPYRYAQTIPGNSLSPPTSPQNFPAPFAFTEGQKLFLRANVCDDEAKIGVPTYYDCVAAA